MLVKPIFKAFDKLQGPKLFQLVWHLLTRVSQLNADEQNAVSLVFGLDTVRWEKVRVAEGRVLRLIFRLNRSRAFTVFHTINLPASGHHSRGNLDLLVHEMVHVWQFENVGSVYIWQALKAQRSVEGYDYGGWQKLVTDRQNGWKFSGYNREQQGHIAQDYYADVLTLASPPDPEERDAFQPFIEELKAGLL